MFIASQTKHEVNNESGVEEYPLHVPLFMEVYMASEKLRTFILK